MNTEKLKRLDDLFQEEMKREHLKGAAIKVYQKGKVWFENEYGSCKEDTIYKIYSMTKPITATAVMILYERGKIDLADPVSKYLPAFSNLKIRVGDEIKDAKNVMTINHLLNMTSGIVYPGEEDEAAKDMENIRVQLVNRVKAGERLDTIKICNELIKCPLAFEPGEKWRYGASADMLGAVVETVSGMKYEEFLKKEIFEPLHMNDTGFTISKKKMNRFASFYTLKENTDILRDVTKEEKEWLGILDPTIEPNIQSAGGGLYSTREDYFKFAKMLLQKGSSDGVSILGAKTVEYMTLNQLTKEQLLDMNWETLMGYGYGNLMRTKIDEAKALCNGSIGEFGWDGLAGTYFDVSPKDDLIILYMQQHKHGADPSLRRKMRNIIFGAINMD